MKGHHVHCPLYEVMVSSVTHNVGRYCSYTGGQFDSFFLCAGDFGKEVTGGL